MTSLDTNALAHAAANATDGIAAEIAAIGGTPEQQVAVQAAMADMLLAVDFERNARVVLSEGGFSPDTVEEIISKMREGLRDDMVVSPLAGRTFVDVDIKDLVIDGINVAHAFEYLRKHRTAPGGYYYLTHKRDGTFVGDDENVNRMSSGEVAE